MDILTLKNTPEISKSLLNKQVYDVLRNLIIENQLEPGTKLSAAKLSKELGVGRSPVATALSALERDGYVQIIPQAGTIVKDYSREELDIIYRARMSLEGLVIEIATHKSSHKKLLDFRERFVAFEKYNKLGKEQLLEMFYLDVELHDYFAEAIPEVVRKEYNNICDLTKRSRLLNLDYAAGKYEAKRFVEENITVHIQIIDAMIQGDVTTAARLAEKDILVTKDNILDFLY